MNSRILVVDDDKWTREFVRAIIEKEGYQVNSAAGGRAALKKIEDSIYDLVITDLVMEDYNGIDVLKKAKEQSYDPEVIVITGYSSVETAVKTLKLGAYDYLNKPLDPGRTILTIKQALEKRKLRREVESFRSHVEEKFGVRQIIAMSPKMRDVMRLIDLVITNDSAVLIEGESGTGKELVARAIHFEGPRASNHFIALNCGALPEQLLESELFGHVKGAFTGADSNKKGIFEEADGGTLLLDEVGDMPLSLQVKLLRVLENGEVRKVGSTKSICVDVRIISSTNRHLSSLLKEGKFREDLYYRLKVVPITLPPLRERKEDIMPLLDHFLKVYSIRFKKNVRGFSDKALVMLLNYNWPGNIRELENLVEGAVIFSQSSVITPKEILAILQITEIPKVKRGEGHSDLNIKKRFIDLEKEYILKALEENNWNQVKSARDLGIGRSTLWRKMEKMHLKKPL
jgi:DNA-binding NtrC family response regulator